MVESLTPEHPFFAEHAHDILFDLCKHEEGDSIETAFVYFKEVASSMFTSAEGVMGLGVVQRVIMSYGWSCGLV